uniref:Uncharacterized protein n=1 Tax=Panagrolaimus sp. PS1159 TaxID=55785 RepID=A0AC35FFA0_9BILA
MLFIIFLISCFVPIGSISLDTLVCRRRPNLCDPSSEEKTLPLSQRSIPPTRDEKGPTIPINFIRESDNIIPKIPKHYHTWADYGVTHDDGTGYGSGIGPGYGQGMGDVAIKTGVGIASPVGNLGIRRDFEVGWGGSGRIGGQPIGFGNGYQGNGYGSSLSDWPKPPPFTNSDIWPLG